MRYKCKNAANTETSCIQKTNCKHRNAANTENYNGSVSSHTKISSICNTLKSPQTLKIPVLVILTLVNGGYLIIIIMLSLL